VEYYEHGEMEKFKLEKLAWSKKLSESSDDDLFNYVKQALTDSDMVLPETEAKKLGGALPSAVDNSVKDTDRDGVMGDEASLDKATQKALSDSDALLPAKEAERIVKVPVRVPAPIIQHWEKTSE
jgi:hypothetical protein